MAEWDAITAPDDVLLFDSDVFDVSEAAFAADFCERIVEEDPMHVEALILLGHAYTGCGEYEKGLAVDQQIVSLRPWDCVAFYNLACSYALTGSPADALNALRRAFDLGYRDVAGLLQDDDLASLRSHPEFQRIVSEWMAHRETEED